MKPTKAVLTAASPDHRTLALQKLVDRDGRERSVLEILLREIHSAAIEDVCVIVHPGDGEAYRQATERVPVRLTMIEQAEKRGYGHALSLAKDFVAGQPFLHTVCDHLFLSHDPERSCAQQLLEATDREDCALSAVQSTRETDIHHFGAVAGSLLPTEGPDTLYEIRNVVEKPTPTEAEQRLLVPGLRAGRYLTFFGMHVLPPLVLELLQQKVEAAAATGDPAPIQLSPTLAELAQQQQYGALLIRGERHHISMKYGLFFTQLALALNGSEKAEVLTELVELMARTQS
ncbi:MAG: sugar phosphate nucleotidyltransferase [Verrucomicrobiota bacterium]